MKRDSKSLLLEAETIFDLSKATTDKYKWMLQIEIEHGSFAWNLKYKYDDLRWTVTLWYDEEYIEHKSTSLLEAVGIVRATLRLRLNTLMENVDKSVKLL